MTKFRTVILGDKEHINEKIDPNVAKLQIKIKELQVQRENALREYNKKITDLKNRIANLTKNVKV